MKRFTPVLFVVIGIVVLIVAVSGGSAKDHQAAAARASALTIKKTSLGKTLTDGNGRVLYLFQADKRNVSKLSKAGFAVWPAFTSVHRPKAEGAVKAALIGTTSGRFAARQVTYNGHPLYYYVGDHGAGSTRGQGLNQFGALWYVLSANGNAVTHAPRSTAGTAAPAAPPAPSGGYGY